MALRGETAAPRGEGVDRRTFLKATLSAGGALLLAAYAQGGTAQQAAPAFARPLAFIRIDSDGNVTLTVPKSEMGQAVRTSLAMLIAEELECDWPRVRVATAPLDPAFGDQGTGGSGSISACFDALRETGAAMRAMLIAAAAVRWKMDAAQLTARDGVVIDAAGNRRLPYGDLAREAAAQSVPQQPALKSRRDWKLLGTSQRGKDIEAIAHGRAAYGIDVRLPGMLFAAILRPREFGATVESFDARAALKVPGVKRVFSIEPVGRPSVVHGGVVVVATNTWAAFEGRKQLAVRWKSGPHAAESSASYAQATAAALDAPPAIAVNKLGDPDTVLAAATNAVRADYHAPFLAHATLEPQNCTAHWRDGKLTVWAPTQVPSWAAGEMAKAIAIKRDQVAVNVTLLGGGFGRRINPDFCVEAALVAKQLTAPVQVVWSREDDLTHDFYRPSAAHRLEACLDAAGYPAAVRHRLVNPAIVSTYRGENLGTRNPGVEEGSGVADMFYRSPHRRSDYALLASGVPRGWWRAVSSTHTTFAMESFIDELAAFCGRDPVAYRLALIDRIPFDVPADEKDYAFDPERMKECLRRAAAKIDWSRKRPDGQGVGIACCFDHRSYAAVAMELDTAEGRVRLKRIVCVADCGVVIHPDGARAQLEGAITQGLSAALFERITIAAGGVTQTNFDRYRLLRIDEAPHRIECEFVERENVKITGLGEPALPPVAPALANALYRATGKRLRALPLDLASIGLRWA